MNNFGNDINFNGAAAVNSPVKPPKKKKSFVFRFFRLVMIIIGVFVIISAAVVFGYSQMFGGASISEAIAKELGSNLVRDSSIFSIFDKLPERTNFVILGLDDDSTRTDVIMVGCYNSKTVSLDLISIPRDTYAVIPKERRDMLAERKLYCPPTGEMKINAVHHYAGKELGIEFIVKQLEEMLDIKIQYYVRIDLQAFRDIVDEIGGIEFDVPQRMYYNDPEQDLYIDLQPGLQVLDGKQAEGLVRYRKSDQKNPISKGYAESDIQRVRVQQDFMKAVITQVLQKDKLLSNGAGLVSTAAKYVTTNFMVADIAKYMGSAKDLQIENIHTYTVPISDIKAYVYIDKAKTRELVDEIFYSQSDNTENQDEEIVGSIGKRIKVLNGGYTSGLAAKTRDTLTEKGFTISSIGDFDGEKQKNTVILVRNEGEGKDLAKLFENSEISVDKSMESGYDIVIILGTSAK